MKNPRYTFCMEFIP